MIDKDGRKAKCPQHPGEYLHRLRYQHFDRTAKKPRWVQTDWYYCNACDMPVQYKTTIEITRTATATASTDQHNAVS